jgi:signal transduction histidine kinase
MLEPRNEVDFEVHRQLVDRNSDIPFVIVDKNYKVLDSRNTDFDFKNTRHLSEATLFEFSKYPPIHFDFWGEDFYVYYKQSDIYTRLEKMLNNLMESYMDDIVDNSIFAPVLVVTQDEKTVIHTGNILPEQYADSVELKRTLRQMRQQNNPIELKVDSDEVYLIFYKNSAILNLLQYIPIIFFVIVAAFIFSMIWVFRTNRRAERDNLWVGMSRETAHQLGTPLSSMIGWMEYLRSQNVDETYLVEIEKDLDRLKIITDRFSKIGSEPKMTTENVVSVVYRSISYLQPRLSQKIKFSVNVSSDTVIFASVNSQLTEWVLENLFKNAVDAIGTKDGLIQVNIISEYDQNVVIDVVDNGKGISRDKWKTIFEAGHTTKSRGWGLGLPLSYRIIHDYHKGKIFVVNSTVGGGTTFRIVLNK